MQHRGVLTKRRVRGLTPVVIYALVAVTVTAGLILWDRAVPYVRVRDPDDPRIRARAAAQSITGQQTVWRVDLVDGKRLVVQATSRYYDPALTREANREYLATEGRLIVQLILHDVPEIGDVRVELYSGRQRVAVVEGKGEHTYDNFPVSYDGPLR